MTDDATMIPDDEPVPAPAATTAATLIDEPVADAPVTHRCPWCSFPLPPSAVERCPNCHANLAEGGAAVPGLTEVEGAAAVRARRAEGPKRSKLLSWISG